MVIGPLKFFGEISPISSLRSESSVNTVTGIVTYTPNADFNGTDTFTYTNSEGNTGTVTVTVDAVNDETVVVDDAATTNEDAAVDIAVLANILNRVINHCSSFFERNTFRLIQ